MQTFILGILVLTLVCTAATSKLFRKVNKYPLIEDSNISRGKVKSPKECSLNAASEHIGFIYNHTDSTCHLLTCANPAVHNGLSNSSTEVYYLHPLTANHLLARGLYM